MGQIFYSCVYDVENMTCAVHDADKFHANCYSYSGCVAVAHYLLRQKPYRVMWGGSYVDGDDIISDYSRNEDLIGLSTYLGYEDIGRNKKWRDKAKFINDHSTRWKRMRVWDDAIKYFNMEQTLSIDYSGFLVNHSQKKAVDLARYYEQSRSEYSSGDVFVIDLIPVLTETGGGTEMALFDGASCDSTEQLAETWRGDLLQITGSLPPDCELMDCCFAEIWSRARYCYGTFGVDNEGCVLDGQKGTRLQCVKFNMSMRRGTPNYIKAKRTKEKIIFTGIPADN